MKWISAWLACGTNCLTTPVSVTTFFWSYIANEWCVETGIWSSTASDAASAEALTVRVHHFSSTDTTIKNNEPRRYLKMSVIADGSSSCGLSQPFSKFCSQFLAHGRP